MYLNTAQLWLLFYAFVLWHIPSFFVVWQDVLNFFVFKRLSVLCWKEFASNDKLCWVAAKRLDWVLSDRENFILLTYICGLAMLYHVLQSKL